MKVTHLCYIYCILNHYIMNKLDKFYISGEQKRIIDTYFNGVEKSTKEFNEVVYQKWLQERKEKRNRVIGIASLILTIVGIILAVIFTLL